MTVCSESNLASIIVIYVPYRCAPSASLDLHILTCLPYFPQVRHSPLLARKEAEAEILDMGVQHDDLTLVKEGGHGFPEENSVRHNYFGVKPATEDDDWGNKECPVKELYDVEDFYKYVKHTSMKCDRAVMVGGQRKTHPPHLEGNKWVCISDFINLVPGKCLVYSFGIERDFTFDDEMDNKFMCEVHSFDPTINMKTQQRSIRSTFHHLGLSNVSRPNGPGMKIERYENILSQLGHTDAKLDYLKIDIEGYETNFFNDVFTNNPNLLKNVKQIGMEIHPRKGGAGKVHMNRIQSNIGIFGGYMI
ncbi:hypothetical protein Pcinc_024753 [Petrolisthes cinctipes]|uniref:Methyltransferase domain-containing protein n=1 Tax=Petrolisthes cinctipes TaxID=88211 RepID=A0AAE1FC05_PETCI|nr:hypothetical protein Pcinc_024753 [Petrolisthes cinctipes]